MTTPTAQTLVEVIEQHQQALSIDDEQLALAMGYHSATVVQVIKGGQMRLPINMVAPLARTLEIEPGVVMEMLLRETAPAMLEAIEECMGPLSLNPGEKRLLTALRKAAQGRETAPVFIEGATIIAMVVG